MSEWDYFRLNFYIRKGYDEGDWGDSKNLCKTFEFKKTNTDIFYAEYICVTHLKGCFYAQLYICTCVTHVFHIIVKTKWSKVGEKWSRDYYSVRVDQNKF